MHTELRETNHWQILDSNSRCGLVTSLYCCQRNVFADPRIEQGVGEVDPSKVQPPSSGDQQVLHLECLQTIQLYVVIEAQLRKENGANGLMFAAHTDLQN